jgi:hypothetical protein
MEFSGDGEVMANAAVVGRRESWEIIVIIFINCGINEVMFFSGILLLVAKLYVLLRENAEGVNVTAF